MFMTSPKDWPALREAEQRIARAELRDRFAIAALPLLAGGARTPSTIARSAYEIADAMLAERTKTK